MARIENLGLSYAKNLLDLFEAKAGEETIPLPRKDAHPRLGLYIRHAPESTCSDLFTSREVPRTSSPINGKRRRNYLEPTWFISEPDEISAVLAEELGSDLSICSTLSKLKDPMPWRSPLTYLKDIVKAPGQAVNNSHHRNFYNLMFNRSLFFACTQAVLPSNYSLADKIRKNKEASDLLVRWLREDYGIPSSLYLPQEEIAGEIQQLIASKFPSPGNPKKTYIELPLTKTNVPT